MSTGLKYIPFGFPGCSAVKESACKAGDLASIPGSGRSPGEGKGYPLQYSGLENSMDCIVHEVAELDTTERVTLTHSGGLSNAPQIMWTGQLFLFACISQAPKTFWLMKDKWPCKGRKTYSRCSVIVITKLNGRVTYSIPEWHCFLRNHSVFPTHFLFVVSSDPHMFFLILIPILYFYSWVWVFTSTFSY